MAESMKKEKGQGGTALPSRRKEQDKPGQEGEEQQVVAGKDQQIPAGTGVGALGVEPESDQAGQGGHQGAQAADIGSRHQGGPLPGEGGEHHRRRHIG